MAAEMLRRNVAEQRRSPSVTFCRSRTPWSGSFLGLFLPHKPTWQVTPLVSSLALPCTNAPKHKALLIPTIYQALETLRLQVMNVECSFLRRPNQSACDALFHSWHEDLVPEPLPALLESCTAMIVQPPAEGPAAWKIWPAGRLLLLGWTAANDFSYWSLVPPRK